MKVKDLPDTKYYRIKVAFDTEIPNRNFYNSWGEAELKELHDTFKKLSEPPNLLSQPNYKKIYDVIRDIYLKETKKG